MSGKNFGDLLIESKHSRLQKKEKHKSTYHQVENRRKCNNLEDSQSRQGIDLKKYKKVKGELSLQREEIEKVHSSQNEYKEREIEWRKNQKLLKQEIFYLRNQVIKLQEDIQLLKHNHQNEISYFMKKEKQTLKTLSTLLETNQVQRMEIYLQNQLSNVDFSISLTDRDRDSNLFPKINHLFPSDLAFIEEFVSKTEKNIDQISINLVDIKKLPQMKKFQKQLELTEKKLIWYLEQPPFEEKDRTRSEKIAQYLLKSSDQKTGKEIIEIIIKLLTNKNDFFRNEKRKSTLTNFKSEMSELIESNTLSMFRHEGEYAVKVNDD